MKLPISPEKCPFCYLFSRHVPMLASFDCVLYFLFISETIRPRGPHVTGGRGTGTRLGRYEKGKEWSQNLKNI